jgi:hypothetical protein
MGIRFNCQHCGRRMNVKEHLAGKRGICPACGGRFDIPLTDSPGDAAPPSGVAPNPASPAVPPAEPGPFEAEINFTQPEPAPAVPAAEVAPAVIAPVAATMPDPIAEAPQMQWYIAIAGSTNQFGPADGELFRTWIAEGRVAPDSMVWREGWPEWKVASTVLPQLQAFALPPHAPVATAPSAPRPSPWSVEGELPGGGPAVAGSTAAKPAPARAPSAAEKRKVPLSIYIMGGLVVVLAIVLVVVLKLR